MPLPSCRDVQPFCAADPSHLRKSHLVSLLNSIRRSFELSWIAEPGLGPTIFGGVWEPLTRSCDLRLLTDCSCQSGVEIESEGVNMIDRDCYASVSKSAI